MSLAIWFTVNKKEGVNMFGIFYDYCPCCGYLHDDGGEFLHQNQRYYLCLNCLDLPEKDRVKNIQERANEKEIWKYYIIQKNKCYSLQKHTETSCVLSTIYPQSYQHYP